MNPDLTKMKSRAILMLTGLAASFFVEVIGVLTGLGLLTGGVAIRRKLILAGLFAVLLTVNAPCAVFDIDTFSDGDFSITAHNPALGPMVWTTSDNTGSMIGGERTSELSSSQGDTSASVSGGVLTLPPGVNGANI